MKLMNKFIAVFKRLGINRRIRKYKYVHLMFNDKFNKPFVDFLNDKFNPDEHVVLCKRFFNDFPFPSGVNVIEVTSFRDIDLRFADKVICHSLFDHEVVDYLYNHPDILRDKAYWVVWGGDLYNAKRDQKNDYVRKNFKGYISDTDGDCDVAKQKYNSCPETYEAGYTFPITKEMLGKAKIFKHSSIRIQINNSCDETTLDMLDTLAKFKDEDIEIITILSYGQMYVKESIITKGKQIFGDRFSYIEKFLSPAEYAKHIAQNDILILNQTRQQGLGNCFVSLALGCKVFIRSGVTTYNHFYSRGIQIFDTNDIKKLRFKDFVHYDDKMKRANMKKSLLFFDNDDLAELWVKVFR